jgi:glycosyltransferase involved in cell wall biosynthesis
MIKNYTLSLIIPCKNEAKALETVLVKLPKQIDEVIVVDNNSTDQTKKVAQRFGAKIFSEARNDRSGIGYGYAIQKGLSQAHGDIIICMDGDGSYPIHEVSSIINHLLQKKLDFISCNRLPFKHPQKMSSIRALGVKILNLTTRFLYGYKIKDSLTGMWVFRKSALDSLTLTEGGWNFSLEIKLKTVMDKSLNFAERQISYQDRVLDLSKQNLVRTGLRHLFYLIKLRFYLLLELTYKTNYDKLYKPKMKTALH